MEKMTWAMFHKSAWIILIGFAFVLFNPSDPGGSKGGKRYPMDKSPSGEWHSTFC